MSSATDDIVDNVSATNDTNNVREPSTDTPEDLDVFVKELMDTSKLDLYCIYITIIYDDAVAYTSSLSINWQW